MIIYIFGNPLLEYDNLPVRLKPELEKRFPAISFVEIDPSENLKPENKELFIIDTAEGLNEVRVLTDIAKIESSPIYSLHDFDLGMTLKLLQKIGTLEKATVFCVPMNGEKNKTLNELIEKIKAI